MPTGSARTAWARKPPAGQWPRRTRTWWTRSVARWVSHGRRTRRSAHPARSSTRGIADAANKRSEAMTSLTTLLTGVSLGAGAMYLMDPERGDRRRAELRDALAELADSDLVARARQSELVTRARELEPMTAVRELGGGVTALRELGGGLPTLRQLRTGVSAARQLGGGLSALLG